MVLSKSSTRAKQIIEIVNKALADGSQPPASEKVLESPMAPAAGPESQAKGIIVLLEDHADTRAIISLVLRRKGHQVTCIYTQADAMMLAKSNHVDLFLINRGRGDSAVLFCREVRAAFPSTPAIVYSTAASETEKHQPLPAAPLPYLLTP